MTRTPGPWAYDADSHEIFSTDEAHSSGYLASVRGNDSNGRLLTESERLANARLIATAPELLQAIKAAVAVMTGWSYTSIADAGDTETVRLCKAVIAKAEGRTT